MIRNLFGMIANNVAASFGIFCFSEFGINRFATRVAVFLGHAFSRLQGCCCCIAAIAIPVFFGEPEWASVGAWVGTIEGTSKEVGGFEWRWYWLVLCGAIFSSSLVSLAVGTFLLEMLLAVVAVKYGKQFLFWIILQW